MTKKEFTTRVNELLRATQHECAGVKLSGQSVWFGRRLNVLQYAAVSEACMERRLKENGKERKTTFMHDLSLGEWFGWRGLRDTIKNAMTSWKDDEVYMAEFVLAVNWKAWEHDARGNYGWTRVYSVLYELIRDLVYDYYEGDEKKTAYVWQYLD